VLSQLEEMGLRPVRELVSRILDYAFIPSPIPPELLEQVTRIEGVRMVHKSMPRAAGGMTTRPPRVPLFATVFDELLGEVGVPGIVTPPEAVPEILPGPASLLKALGNLAYPFAGVNPLVNIRVFTTSDTFGIVKDRPTRDGEGVRVAVLDTGSPAHTPEHLGNLSKLEEHTVIPEPPQDGHSHGSWCHNAVCGAYGLSPYGPLVGGAPAVERSIHVKCLNTFPGTGSTEGVLKAIEIAVNRGARLLSMSLGGPAQGDSVEGDVECRIVNELSERGVIFAIAAGNSGHDPWTVGAPGVALKSVCCASASVMDVALAPRPPRRRANQARLLVPGGREGRERLAARRDNMERRVRVVRGLLRRDKGPHGRHARMHQSRRHNTNVRGTKIPRRHRRRRCHTHVQRLWDIPSKSGQKVAHGSQTCVPH